MKPVNLTRANTRIYAFTVVEMLVALGVFSILMVMMSQMLTEVADSIVAQKEHMDSLEEARFSLDRMMLDWSSRVRVGNVTGSYQSQVGNDQFTLVSQVSAFSGTRDLSEVTYSINSTNYVLQRGVLGYDTSSSDPAPDGNPILQFPFQSSTLPVIPPSDFDQVSGAIFRMEICFLRTTASPTTGFTINSQNLPTTNLVVAVATLDERSRKILTSGQMAKLVSALPDVTDGQDPQSQWLQTINSSNFASSAGVPASTAAAIHIYQRVLLNNQ